MIAARLFAFLLTMTLVASPWLTLPSPPPTAAPIAWTSLDGPRGGPAQAIAFSPEVGADRVIFAGGGRDFGRGAWAGRGLFRSRNDGRDWEFGGTLANGAVLDIAVSPNWGSDHLALAGLWQGVWLTTDAGATWQQLEGFNPSGGPGFVSAVAISPNFAADRTFLAGGAYGGVYRSTDAGAIWSHNADAIAVRRVAFQPTNSAVALAAAANGLWRSSDGGANWSQTFAGVQIYDIAFLGERAFAAFSDHVWESADAGVTWTPLGDLTTPRLDPLAVTPNSSFLFTASGTATLSLQLRRRRLAEPARQSSRAIRAAVGRLSPVCRGSNRLGWNHRRRVGEYRRRDELHAQPRLLPAGGA